MDKYIVVIPNTITPYGYEMVPILAYPEGFKYRFRYDEEWVDKSLFLRNDLKGKEGYIVLRDFESGHLFPIRKIKLRSFQKIGKIFYIETVLGKLAPFDSDSSHRDNQVERFNNEFMKFHSALIDKNDPGKNMKPLVFLTNYIYENIKNEHKSSDVDEELESFGNILACFKNISFFKDVQFLRLVSAEPFDKKIGKAYFQNGTLVFKEGADYEIQVAQFIVKTSESGLKQTDISINGDNRQIDILRGVQRAVGKYDILTFVIHVHDRGNANATFLDVHYLPKPSSQEIGEPHLFIPVLIDKAKRKLINKIIISTIFLIVYIGPSITSIFPWNWLQQSSGIIKDISIVGITISLLSVIKELKRRNY